MKSILISAFPKVIKISQHVLMQIEVSPPTATPKYTKEHHSVTVSSGALTGYNNGFKNCSNRNTPINQHNSQVPP